MVVWQWEALDTVDHGDGEPEPCVKSGGGKVLRHVDMGSEVAKIVCDDD